MKRAGLSRSVSDLMPEIGSPPGSLSLLIIGLAIPNIVSNITIPLLSLIDIGLAGHMGHPEAIGSVTVAATIANTIYWLFGFIRLGTTGLVAQAYGRQDVTDVNRQLGRGLSMALICSIVILIFSPLASSLSGVITGGASDRLGEDACEYLQIIFYAAPAAMAIYALNGWYIGMQNTRIPMIGSIAALVVNFIVSYSLVVHADMGVRGLAIGTSSAQYFQALLLAITARVRYRHVLSAFRWKLLTDTSGYGRYLIMGRDLILRSFLLSSVTLFFTYAGVREGTIAVAANTLLMQFFSIFSYFMDGFAYAGESLSGRFVGMRRIDLVDRTIRTLFSFGIVLSLAAFVAILLYPTPLLRLLSTHEEIVQYAVQYHVWAALIPLMGFGAFLWDGIYVGTTQSAALKWSMILSSIVFFALYYLLYPYLQLTALWIAFDSYLLARAVVMTVQWFTKYRRELVAQS